MVFRRQYTHPGMGINQNPMHTSGYRKEKDRIRLGDGNRKIAETYHILTSESKSARIRFFPFQVSLMHGKTESEFPAVRFRTL